LVVEFGETIDMLTDGFVRERVKSRAVEHHRKFHAWIRD
jgi:hypothetical protein